jgi:hypothetical protein
MQVVLLILVLAAGAFLFMRIENHTNVAKEGGIRKKYNLIFSFIYNLSGSKITFETKSLVKFKVDSRTCNHSFVLYYNNMGWLDVKCTTSYTDDTPFNNGTTTKWQVTQYSKEEKVLGDIKQYLSELPNSGL